MYDLRYIYKARKLKDGLGIFFLTLILSCWSAPLEPLSRSLSAIGRAREIIINHEFALCHLREREVIIYPSVYLPSYIFSYFK